MMLGAFVARLRLKYKVFKHPEDYRNKKFEDLPEPTRKLIEEGRPLVSRVDQRLVFGLSRIGHLNASTITGK